MAELRSFRPTAPHAPSRHQVILAAPLTAVVALTSWAALPAASGLAAQQTVSLPAEDTAIELERTELYRVGEIEGEPWEVYGTVDAVAFDRAGNLYVLDGQNARIVVLGPSGEHLRTLGRRGEGPGEFQLPQGVAVTVDDRVVVYDAARRSYSLLDAEGEFLWSVPVDVIGLAASPRGRLAPHPAGGFLAEFRGLNLDTGDPQTSRDDGLAFPVRRYPGDEAGTSTELFRGTSAGPPATMFSRPGQQRVQMGGAPAFSPVFRWGALPDGGAAFMDGVTYAVRIVGPDGAPLRTITRPFEPRAVTDRDRSDERARRLEALESTGQGAPTRITDENGVISVTRDEAMGRRMIEQLQFAETLAVLVDLRVDPEGRIWVERRGERVGGDGPVDILGADGAYLGSVALEGLPDAFGPGARAAWIDLGEYGVPTVRVETLRLAGN